MSRPGTPDQPLRVAIVGAGPAAFYAAEQLLRQPGLAVEVDMLDRLPTPFGLVRGGVAPDHQKIKAVTAVFDKIAALPGFRFFGGVELGKHVSVDDLRRHYHQILYATGAQTDRRMGIPGEDLRRSHPATEFVAWYNGHPEFRDSQFDLSQERVAVVGVGNVAIDVARMLSRTPEELEGADIADYALEALRKSRVREVYLLGRRGPAQAAFTNPEIKELGELADADIVSVAGGGRARRVEPGRALRVQDRATMKKVEIVQSYASRPPSGKRRRLHLRFLVSPLALIGNTAAEVTGIRLVRNRLIATPTGTLQAQPTGDLEDLPVGLVFRSVGYRGVPLPGVPFNESWGVVLNDRGRVLVPIRSSRCPASTPGGGSSAAPRGDRHEQARCRRDRCGHAGGSRSRCPSPSRAPDGLGCRADAARSAAPVSVVPRLATPSPQINEPGHILGRPRLKFTRMEDMLAALGR